MAIVLPFSSIFALRLSFTVAPLVFVTVAVIFIVSPMLAFIVGADILRVFLLDVRFSVLVLLAYTVSPL